MSAKTTTVSWGTSGIKTIATSFLPDEAEFDVFLFGGETGGDRHTCFGWTDGSNQTVKYDLRDDSSGETLIDTDPSALIHIKEWNPGTSTWDTVFLVQKDSFNATSLKVNVVTPNPSYQVRVKTRG